ncbi:MAG: EAL domain-containing protein, partial [Chloroflexi bacterium]|nr:EAL domain-containing protein [Chloroflexota bacterium]
AGPAASAYVVDGRGRAIAHPNPDQVAFLADLSAAPPVVALLAASGEAGAIVYTGPEGRMLASYARPPGLSWGIVVERSEAEALAGMRFRRDAAFVLLLLCVGVAGGAGAAAASGLIRPLQTLARSVERFVAGEMMLLPHSSVSEINALAGALGLLRDRLGARTAEREQALDRLGASERRFRLLAENAQDIVYRYRRGPAPGFEYISPAVAAVAGYAPEDFAADPDLERRAVALDDWPQWREAMQTGDEFAEPVTLRWVRPDGAPIWLEWRHAPIRDEAGAVIAVEGIARDVTGQRQAETSLRNSNRALMAMMASTPALERAADEASLLRAIGAVLAEKGGYRSVWIGLTEDGGTGVRAAVEELQAGVGAWPALVTPWAEREAGPLAAALRTGAPVAVPDVAAADERFAGWRDAAQRAGDGAAAAFPLVHDGALLGALAVSSAEPGGFDEDEVEILTALTGDLAARLAVQRARTHGRIVAANPAAGALFIYAPEALTLRGRGDLMDLSDPHWAEALEERERTGRFAAEVRMRRSTGEVFPAEVSGAAFPGRGGRSLTSLIVRDISERRRAQEAQQHQALHDALTGLPNRALLEQLLNAAIPAAVGRSQTVALVLINVQRFREVNDAFGHAAGDGLLREISRRLQRTVRQSDTLARLGGDEFAVLAPNLDTPALAERVALRLLEALGAPFPVDGVDFAVRTAAGVALAPQHGGDAATLLRQAEVALSSVKVSGAAWALYDPTQESAGRDQLILMGELRRALAGDELLLYYQPRVAAPSGLVVGAEALVRWRHPTRGFILPATFVSVVERTGLTGDLTRWVLTAAARQLSVWRGAGHDLTVSVNLSAPDLHTTDLPEQIAAALGAWSVPLDRLCVELPAAAAAALPERAAALLGRLRAMRVGTALDDVGGAASSLALLRRLPADNLNMDQSLVRSVA